MQDILIIGGGIAGLTCAMYSARYGFDPLVLEKMYSGGQMVNIHEIENYSGFDDPISGIDLSMRMEKQAKKAGAKIQFNEIQSVELTGPVKRVATKKETFEARAVVICSGAKPRLLGLENEERLTGAGVSYCATCDGALFRGKQVAVAGGGDTAFTDALFLSNFCASVTLIHRRTGFRANAELIERVKARENISFLLDSEIAAIREEEGRVCGLDVKNKCTGETVVVPCEGLFVAVGYTPLTDLFQGQIALNEAGYILTDETMKTSLDGVYAAGDVREKPLRQIITAASDGAVAAYSCAQYLSR